MSLQRNKKWLADKRTYQSWAHMRQRCNNPKNSAYPDYGGRGIKVCERWTSYDLFLLDMGPRPEGRTLERDDVNDGYHKDNCRWATSAEQSINKTSTVYHTYAGETLPQKVWAKKLGIHVNTIRDRLKRGWSVEKALSTPAAPMV